MYRKEWYNRYYLTHKKQILQSSRDWQRRNPKHMARYRTEYHQRIRLLALQKISGLETPQCVSCGCKNMKILQINHKNLGGRRERYPPGHNLYRAIIRGDRQTMDLEVRCSVCNIAHFVDRKFGIRFKVELVS